MPEPGLTIIIPILNENLGIKRVLAELRAAAFAFVREIIVVDDGSQDGSAEMAAAFGVTVIRHERNCGYGAALKTGIAHARTTFFLIMDGDGQHHVQDIPRFWELADHHHMIVGARTSLLHSPFWRIPGKWLLGKLAEFLMRRRIPDINSGFRLIRRDIARKYLHLCPDGFSFTTTITLAFMAGGFSVCYHPIQVRPRLGKSSVTIKVGFTAIYLVLRLMLLFHPMRLFFPVGILCAGLGINQCRRSLQGRESVSRAVGSLAWAALILLLGNMAERLAASFRERSGLPEDDE